MNQDNINPELQKKLWDAAAAGDNATIRFLAMSPGIDFEARDEQERTALNLATGNGHYDTAQTIIAIRAMQRMKAMGIAPGAEKKTSTGKLFGKKKA